MNWLESVHTQEPNDCAICAVQYICRWFHIPEDRTELKRLGQWSPQNGACLPLEWLHQHRLVTPGWICEGLDRITDDVHPGITRIPPTLRNFEILYAAYLKQLTAGAIGLANIMIDAGPHAVVVTAAEPETASLWIACSLRGVHRVSKEEFFTGPGGKIRGLGVWWVRNVPIQGVQPGVLSA